jgi:hypothetical protein
MYEFEDIFTAKHLPEKLLAIVFILFIFMEIQLPNMIAMMIDNIPFKIFIIFLIVFLFIKKHFILAILFVWVAYKLFMIASQTTGIDALQRYMPTEQKKFTELTALNQFPYTLEQEMVKLRTNSRFNNPGTGMGILSSPSYKPFLENTHDSQNLSTV